MTNCERAEGRGHHKQSQSPSTATLNPRRGETYMVCVCVWVSRAETDESEKREGEGAGARVFWQASEADNVLLSDGLQFPLCVSLSHQKLPILISPSHLISSHLISHLGNLRATKDYTTEPDTQYCKPTRKEKEK